jgi:hypothetical protein
MAAENNLIPSFITADGPAREARFKFFLNNNGSLSNTPDGGVHDLYVISGRSDGGSCSIRQPDFAHHLALNNVSFRIPTPVFGAGLIENIPDETILANMNANRFQKNQAGISGHVNRKWKRRHHHAIWLEGTKQIAGDHFRRSLQRRNGRDQ